MTKITSISIICGIVNNGDHKKEKKKNMAACNEWREFLLCQRHLKLTSLQMTPERERRLSQWLFSHTFEVGVDGKGKTSVRKVWERREGLVMWLTVCFSIIIIIFFKHRATYWPPLLSIFCLFCRRRWCEVAFECPDTINAKSHNNAQCAERLPT